MQVSGSLPTLLLYLGAAFAEIAGCFSVWAVLRSGRSVLWLAPGLVCLVVFALLLTFAPAEAAGRAYAAYGGAYILAALAWLGIVEGVAPDRYDLAGAAICLLGAGIILLAPRAGT